MIDAGNPDTLGGGGAACLRSDQLGTWRPQGNTCDIGAGEMQDRDGDGMLDGFEETRVCLERLVPDGVSDPDDDGLTSIMEYVLGTEPCTEDTDADGCTDGEESGGNADFGGDRDPTSFWDFFDVTGDGRIDLSDTVDILSYFGDAGLPSTLGGLRDRDNSGAAQPWQTYESDYGVDLTDALVNLQSFGHKCSGPPSVAEPPSAAIRGHRMYPSGSRH